MKDLEKLKSRFKFVVRINPVSNVSYSETTKIKKHGGPTVESTEVVSKHCFGLVRRDPLYFFINKNSSFMRTKDEVPNMVHETIEAINARKASAILKLCDEPSFLRESLREMMDAYFLYSESSNKEEVYSAYKTIDHVLKQTEELQRRVS